MLDLTGKVALVTGAGSVGPGWSNGKATAVLLARQGAKVFLVDINPEAVAETQAIIEGEGNQCAATTCDMMDSASVKAMVEDCIARFGRIDILVNNVGGSEPGDAVTQSEEAFDRQMDFNLKTAFLGCKYVIPHMENPGKGHACRVQLLQSGRHPVFTFDRRCLCPQKHSLQHRYSRPDAHAAG